MKNVTKPPLLTKQGLQEKVTKVSQAQANLRLKYSRSVKEGINTERLKRPSSNSMRRLPAPPRPIFENQVKSRHSISKPATYQASRGRITPTSMTGGPQNLRIPAGASPISTMRTIPYAASEVGGKTLSSFSIKLLGENPHKVIKNTKNW